MANILIHRITNANIYMDGANLLGRAEEIELPQVKVKMAEHKALGMVGTIRAFSGIEALEGKIKWASFYADVLKKAANPFKTVQLQVRGSLEGWNTPAGRNTEKPVVAVMQVLFKNFPLGQFKQHENVEITTEFDAWMVKLTAEGQDILEIDVAANIYKAGGVDMLANYRANIGG
ncbi:phage major tail tube protein [Caldimonas manganoxidans]|jgi:P2 family phage contractile tail tube protein|uniref:phage major tail tube protein n=1 Tax=Caldimonas manganoxidans TaxID=196015 RepID=UPI00035D803C|nr:phage major tail tube protein [Caldimonas manganoxidans]